MAKKRSIWHNRAKYSFTFSFMNKSYAKSCKICHSIFIKKDGKMRGKQRYKCICCGHVFQNKSRKKTKRKNKDFIQKLWFEYCFKKQSYEDLSQEYKVSIRSIQKYLDAYEFIPPQVMPCSIILIMDTTYFWDIWVMVFKDSKKSKILHYELVKNETNDDYKLWVKKLQEQGWKIEAIVCDGKKWLLKAFSEQGIPTQMCQFHQVAILRRYITKKPILEANKDLKILWELLKQTDKETFEYELQRYYEIYKDFLNEKRINAKWKREYIHKRTRSAYFSLKNNLKYLFTWYDYHWVLDIPNTTNALEWVFGHLKVKVSLHRGLKKERKIKLILSLLHWKS